MPLTVTITDARELIRLARLGLWAEEKAMPALKGVEDIARVQVQTYMAIPLQTGTQTLRDWNPILVAIKAFKDMSKKQEKTDV